MGASRKLGVQTIAQMYISEQGIAEFGSLFNVICSLRVEFLVPQ